MNRIRTRCHRCDEQGAALVMVLAFLSLFGLAIASLLSFSQTSFKTTVAVRSQSESLYAADGAVEGAINAVRYDTAAGVSNSEAPCNGFDPPALNSVDLTVTCTGNTVAGGPSGAAATNVPERAVFTTDGSTRPGIVQSSNNDVSIAGDVFVSSRSTLSAIDVSTGSNLVVSGDVGARGLCPRVSTVGGTVACTALTPVATAPVYPVDATLPAYMTLPTTCPSAAVIDVQPGYYDSASALTFISRCAGKIVWFHPGVYYFDFQDAPGPHEWIMDSADTYLTGGTPGGSPAWDSTSNPTLPLAIPGSCDPTKAGVKFIFGGDSRIRVEGGKLELCANPTSPTSTTQQIALYGLSTGSASSSTTTLTPATALTLPGEFTSPDNAKAIDTSVTSDYVSPGTAASTAGITLSYPPTPPSAIPAGSVINSVTLRVVYNLLNVSNVTGLEATVTAGDSSGTRQTLSDAHNNCAPVAGSLSSKLCRQSNGRYDQTFDVAAALKGTSASSSLAKLANSQVTFGATVKGDNPPRNASGVVDPGTVQLDGVTIAIGYTPPAFRAWTGCSAGDTSYLPNQNCALLKVLGNPSQVSIHGTLYAPTAPIDLALTNQSTQVVDRGVVSSVLWLTKTASSSFSGSPISLPSVPPAGPAGRIVTIRAYKGSTLLLVAEVAVDDTIPAHPVSISHWSHQR